MYPRTRCVVESKEIYVQAQVSALNLALIKHINCSSYLASSRSYNPVRTQDLLAKLRRYFLDFVLEEQKLPQCTCADGGEILVSICRIRVRHTSVQETILSSTVIDYDSYMLRRTSSHPGLTVPSSLEDHSTVSMKLPRPCPSSTEKASVPAHPTYIRASKGMTRAKPIRA